MTEIIDEKSCKMVCGHYKHHCACGVVNTCEERIAWITRVHELNDQLAAMTAKAKKAEAIIKDYRDKLKKVENERTAFCDMATELRLLLEKRKGQQNG